MQKDFTMKLLLTGFEPFGKIQINPSQLIVEHFAKQGNTSVVTEILPVVYKAAGECIKDLFSQHQPDAILMLGVAGNREEINLERIAINVNDAAIADNKGFHAQGQRIIENAPVGYWSTLPLLQIHEAISQEGIAVKYSNHAGAYLCNHVFYSARHLLETTRQAQIPCGFIHVPPLEKMEISLQIRAIEAGMGCLRTPTN